MTATASTPGDPKPQTSVAFVLAGVLAQVGCVTLLLVAFAIFAGLWLDTHFDTKPLFTVVLVLASVPVTFYLIVRSVIRAASRLQRNGKLKNDPVEIEEDQRGKHP